MKDRDPQPDASAGADADTPFETALVQLEAVVDRLERGDLELEEALAAFEQGVALTRRCAAQLETAEARIEVLMREGDAWIARPFEAGAGGARDSAGVSSDEEEDR